MMHLLLFVAGLFVHANRVDSTPHALRPVSKLEFDCAGIADGFYPNPISCSAYYMCVKYNAYHSECEPGMLFHPATRYCQNATTVQCQTTGQSSLTTTVLTSPTTVSLHPSTAQTSRTTLIASQPPQTTHTRTQMSTQPTVSGRPASTVDCSIHHDGEYLADPTDCAGFYVCDHGNPVHEQCAPGLYFSPTIHVCDFKVNVKNCP